MCKQKEYFRVINYNEENDIIDTKKINYGKISLPIYKKYEPFAKKILELEDKYKYDYNIEIYILLLEMLHKNINYIEKDDKNLKRLLRYLKDDEKYIEKDDEKDKECLKRLLIHLKFDEKDIERDYVYIYRIAGIKYGRKKYIEFDNLLTIAKNFLPFVCLLELPVPKESRLNKIDMLNMYLGEIFFEEERKLNFPQLPSRLESFFLFKDIETANNYKNMYDGHIIKIIPETISNYFEGDMTILDCIKFHMNFYNKSHTISQLKRIVHNYWSGEKTYKPMIEILFQGTCRIEKVIK